MEHAVPAVTEQKMQKMQNLGKYYEVIVKIYPGVASVLQYNGEGPTIQLYVCIYLNQNNLIRRFVFILVFPRVHVFLALHSVSLECYVLRLCDRHVTMSQNFLVSPHTGAGEE